MHPKRRLFRRARRVRVHLVDANPHAALPSVEGLLVARRRSEYLIALPALLNDPDANPIPLDARLLAIPRERVAFYEIAD